MQVDTSKLHIGEIELLQWQYGGDLGHFKTALWQAIQHADLTNLSNLQKGYPEQVDAYRRFIGQEGYWKDVLMRSGLVPAAPPAANDIPAPETPPSPPSQYDH